MGWEPVSETLEQRLKLSGLCIKPLASWDPIADLPACLGGKLVLRIESFTHKNECPVLPCLANSPV